MVKNQINLQDSVTTNLQKINSNPEYLLPTPALWFHLLWGDLIIITLIMLMLSFTLQSFQFNLTLNQFQIQTPLLLNQFMVIKWTIYCNYFIQNILKTFCMLNFVWFRLGWCSPPSKTNYTSSTVWLHKDGG